MGSLGSPNGQAEVALGSINARKQRRALRYGRAEQQAADAQVPQKRHKHAHNSQQKFRGFRARLAGTRDIFEMERIVHDIAQHITRTSPYQYGIWADPFINYLRTCNKRVDNLRCPPCSYFNLDLCEYSKVHVHQTRGQTHATGKERAIVHERAHICAVCFAQGMTSPHRVTSCPLVMAVDHELHADWKWQNGH